MYFIEQIIHQFQATFASYFEGPGTPGWTPEAATERAKEAEALSQPAELEDRATRVVADTQARETDAEARVTRLQEVQGPISPTELATAQTELGEGASREAIEGQVAEVRMTEVALTQYAGNIDMPAENLKSLYSVSGIDLSGKTPKEIEKELTRFANDMEKLQILAEKNGLEMPNNLEEYTAMMEQFRSPDGEIRIPISPEEAEASGLVLNPDGSVNTQLSSGYGAGGDAPRGRPYVGSDGQAYSGYEGGANRMNIDIENLTPGVEGLVELIYQAEAGGDPDIIYSGCPIQPPKPITEMTVAEVRQFQDQMVAAGSASTAVGACQVIRDTLDGAIASGVLSPNELFDQNAQKKFTLAKFEERGLSRFQSGSLDEMQFMENLSKEWASLPKDMSGASYYAGDGLNHALVSPEVLLGQLQSIQEEGGSTPAMA